MYNTPKIRGRKSKFETYVFVPYPDLERCAKCFSDKHLFKMRIDIAKCLLELKINPNKKKDIELSALQWIQCEEVFKMYHNMCYDELVSRNIDPKGMKYNINYKSRAFEYPYWYGNDWLHSCHRSRLLYYDWGHYRQFNWTEMPQLIRIWPVKHRWKDNQRKKGLRYT